MQKSRITTIVTAAAALLVLLSARPAFAKHVRFFGPHPIAAQYGGGYCYIEAPHVHIYAPDHQALYHPVDGGYQFVGDPSPFGYDGPKYSFYGPHPVPGAPDVYCYLEGPHSHPYEVPVGPDYRVTDGVAFYIGAPSPVFLRDRPHRERQWAAEYRPMPAWRPTVQVTPPPEWHGTVYVEPPPAAVVVGAPVAPAIVVGAPIAPTVVVAPPRPAVIVAAPRPPSIVVGVPAPPTVVIGAPAPAVIVGAPRPVDVRERGDDDDQGHWHHDNGWHKGWYKHGRH
jgi:hypothetical protein